MAVLPEELPALARLPPELERFFDDEDLPVREARERPPLDLPAPLPLDERDGSSSTTARASASGMRAEIVTVTVLQDSTDA